MESIKRVYEMASQLKMYGEKYAWFAGTKVLVVEGHTDDRSYTLCPDVIYLSLVFFSVS